MSVSLSDTIADSVTYTRMVGLLQMTPTSFTMSGPYYRQLQAENKNVFHVISWAASVVALTYTYDDALYKFIFHILTYLLTYLLMSLELLPSQQYTQLNVKVADSCLSTPMPLLSHSSRMPH